MIPIGEDVPFNKNDSLNGASHPEGSAIITVDESGDYKITFELNYLTGAGFVAITVNEEIRPETSTLLLMDPHHVKGSAQLNLLETRLLYEMSLLETYN